MNGLNAAVLLKTTTRVGTEVLSLALGKILEKTSRNCSSLTAALRISFSPALPIRRKFFDFTLIQVSFTVADAAATAEPWKDASPPGTAASKTTIRTMSK